MTTGKTNQRSSRPSAAFTLLELMLVLVVIGFVLAVAAPAFRGFFESRQPADAAAQVLSLTKWARSEALSHGRCVRLNVDAESGEYWLTAQEGGSYVSPRAEIGRRFCVPERSTIRIQPADSKQPSQAYIEFRPSGRSDAATIEIRGGAGELYKVATDSVTEPYRVISPSEDGA